MFKQLTKDIAYDESTDTYIMFGYKVAGAAIRNPERFIGRAFLFKGFYNDGTVVIEEVTNRVP